MIQVLATYVCLLGFGVEPSAAGAAPAPKLGKLVGVPFTQIKLHDAFWGPRLKTNREKSIPHNFRWCEETGRISNFDKAAGRLEGKFEGIFFNDSDVYKVLEGASYALADHPDPALDKEVDAVIAKIAAAQQPNGYLNTYFTLVEPDKKWINFRKMHELYCAGHLIEAAVAHHRATGKRSFLDVALKLADHLAETFGPDKRLEVPGHEEVELALVKLYQLTGQEKYLKLAEFFVSIRGDAARREVFGPYCQDHLPVCQQSEIVGHAVRAMYLYAGVADVASYTADQGLVGAMDRLWQDVVRAKLYITAGIGARHKGEAFGDRYELPNVTAYCETCAAIGLALWAHRLNLLHGDAQYAEILERALYNGILSGIGMDGEHFFYVNPLASLGNHHRQPFFKCACCPSNVVRFVPSIPGYVYATGPEGLFVNLYVAGEAKVTLAGQELALQQQTRYPWEGAVKLAVRPAQPSTFALHLRVPAWCPGAKLAVNGQAIEKPQMLRGYARIERRWQAGDTVSLDLPMPEQRIEAHPLVEADRGRVAVQRGPVVYCLEQVDNHGPVLNVALAREPKLHSEHRAELLGGVTVIRGVSREGKELLFVPYHAWDHREPGQMAVWVRQDGKDRTPRADDPAWKEILYRPLDAKTLGPSTPPEPSECLTPSASFVNPRDAGALVALHDQIEPADSCDQTIPRFTWWDHKGTAEWVQYDFDAPQKVGAASVYWFDDGAIKRHCRVPKSWRLLYQDGTEWKPVNAASEYGVAKDRWNRVTFTPVTTTALRLEVQLNAPWSGGILEWKVEAE